jgi:hypothetical protein
LSDALQPPSRSITFLTTAKTAARKIDAILNLSRPMQAVQALDAREFHALIQTAGLDQSMELIELASGEQVQALIDFDGWNRDRLEHKRFADWMMILLGCPDESLHRWFAKLDLEPIIVWMREHAQVFLWEEDRDLLDCVDAPVLTSPDGTYAIMVPDDGEPADIVRMLLDRAYAYDLDYGRRLLEAARWELSAQMEEEGYRFRNARLEDLGFVGLDDAAAVYARIDLPAWAAAQRRKLDAGGELVPTPVGEITALDLETRWYELGPAGTQASVTRGALELIRKQSGTLPDAAARGIVAQYGALLQRVSVADGGSPNHISHLRKAAEQADARIELGLAFLTGEDPEKAARALLTVPVRDLHRAGHAIPTRLAYQARTMLERGNMSLTDEPMSLLSAQEVDLFEGLLSDRPLRSVQEAAPFRTMREVEAASLVLADLAFFELWFMGRLRWTRAELVELLFNIEKNRTPVELLGFRSLLATVLVAESIELGAGLRPVTPAEATAWLDSLVASGKPDETVANQAVAVLSRRMPEETKMEAVVERVALRVATFVTEQILSTTDNTNLGVLLQGFVLKS